MLLHNIGPAIAKSSIHIRRLHWEEGGGGGGGGVPQRQMYSNGVRILLYKPVAECGHSEEGGKKIQIFCGRHMWMVQKEKYACIFPMNR